jgi:hypothetical protein
MINRFEELWKMDVVLRESAVTILNWPEVLDDSTWVSNLKAMLQVIASRPPGAQQSKFATGLSARSAPVVAAPSPYVANARTVVAPPAPAAAPIDPNLYAMVASILQQPNGAQQLFQFTQQLPQAQTAQIAVVVKQLLGAAAVQAAPQLLQPSVSSLIPGLAPALATPSIASLLPQIQPGFGSLLQQMMTTPAHALQSNYTTNNQPPAQSPPQSYRGGAGGRGGYGGRSQGPDHRYQHEPYHTNRGGGGGYRGDRGGRGRGRGRGGY